MNGAPEFPYRMPPVLRGQLRSQPEDFVVDEQFSFEPDGQGEHLWLQVRKRGLNTEEVSRQLARHFSVSPRDISYSGMKDRHAVTTQWFSLHLPNQYDRDELSFEDDRVTILRRVRHGRKLRRGTHRGNAFIITLRDVSGDVAALQPVLARIAREGVPNYFGEQRFGRGGANVDKAKSLFAGSLRLKRHQRGIYLSAARSWIFNKVIARRLQAGNWHRLLEGEVLMPDRSHGFFTGTLDDALRQRFDDREIHSSGPLWGEGGLLSSDVVGELERAVANEESELAQGLEAARLKQERRPLRLLPESLAFDWPDDTTLVLSFSLPSGAFATSVLREIVDYQPA